LFADGCPPPAASSSGPPTSARPTRRASATSQQPSQSGGIRSYIHSTEVAQHRQHRGCRRDYYALASATPAIAALAVFRRANLLATTAAEIAPRAGGTCGSDSSGSRGSLDWRWRMGDRLMDGSAGPSGCRAASNVPPPAPAGASGRCRCGSGGWLDTAGGNAKGNSGFGCIAARCLGRARATVVTRTHHPRLGG
jgi:hypothetical protein